MKKAIFCGALITLFHLLGCAKIPDAEPRPQADVNGAENRDANAPAPSRPAEVGPLAKLLEKPRSELAAECADYEAKIHRQEQLRQQGALDVRLLPDARFPLTTPGFREAHYNPAAGFSLPPYLNVGKHDSALALHLARFGDAEAALKLVDPDDVATRQKVEALKLERNYPIEWTRLISLMQHHLAFTLATGIPEAGRELLTLHVQLRDTLSPSAQRGALGAALLPRGLDTLKRCAARTSDSKLPGEMDAFLKTASTPAPEAFRFRTLEDLERVFGARIGQAALVAASPLRVLDLLGLELPHDNMDMAVAFPATSTGRMEWLLAYRPGLHEYARPEQFAAHLDSRRTESASPATPEFPRRSYPFGEGELEVVLTPRHHSLGALVRVTLPPLDAKAAPPSLQRNFGVLSLDRGFQANRRLFAWKEQGKILSVRDAKLRAVVQDPLQSRALLQATVEQHEGGDLVDHVRFDYADVADVEPFSLAQTARPLFERYGAPRLQFGDADLVDLVWSDGVTSFLLRFPAEREKRVSLQVRDTSSMPVEQRIQSARDVDRKERLARLESNKPLAIVPRELDRISLGMTREDFARALPRSPDLIQREIPLGIMASFTGAPRGTGDALAREWFARFDERGRLAELRVRYTDYPGAPAGSVVKKKLDAYRTSLGKPHSWPLSPNPAQGWSATKSTARTHVWHDDLTLLRCNHDAGGVEVVLRDCPPSHPEGAPLPKLEYLPLGVGPIKLGASREAIEKLNPKLHEDALLIESKSKEAFDAYLVWLKNDRVVRIAARHRLAAPMKTPADATQPISEAWSRAKDKIGYPRLFTSDPATRHIIGWGTYDDVTRFRIHRIDDGRSSQLFSEWSRNDAESTDLHLTAH
jgi:hypothetical protein